MGIKSGMKVLDVGCGVGGPAREICKFTDANTPSAIERPVAAYNAIDACSINSAHSVS